MWLRSWLRCGCWMQGGSCSSDLTPSMGISICCWCSPKNKQTNKRNKKTKPKKKNPLCHIIKYILKRSTKFIGVHLYSFLYTFFTSSQNKKQNITSFPEASLFSLPIRVIFFSNDSVCTCQHMLSEPRAFQWVTWFYYCVAFNGKFTHESEWRLWFGWKSLNVGWWGVCWGLKGPGGETDPPPPSPLSGISQSLAIFLGGGLS